MLKGEKDWEGRKVLRPCKKKEGSGRRRIVFELLDVAVLDLLHEGFAFEDIALEIGGELAGDGEKLVVGHFGKRDGAARGNEMGTPLEKEAGVPCDQEKNERGRGREGAARRAEELGEPLEQERQAKDKDGS